ncbi:MAG: hypothetical protein COB54_07600 [Alphaproteobacteria bacterium]|nr:MAG: hypothetical protein COB54_07600 [Alphaproteobacteria bacterium]
MTGFMPVDLSALLNRISLASAHKKNALLPVFEAVQNARQAIEAKNGTEHPYDGKIKVSVMRDLNGFITEFVIDDDGVGLNEENYLAFRTPYTDHNLKRGGRGFGRIIGHKVFARIFYHSNFINENNEFTTRTFEFCTDYGNEIKEKAGDFAQDILETGTTVRLQNFNEHFLRHASLSTETISELLLAHFFSQFAQSSMPELVLQDGENVVNLGLAFTEILHTSGDPHTITVNLNDGSTHQLQASLMRVKKKGASPHIISLLAHGRGVGEARDITQMLGNIKLQDDNGTALILIGCVEGPLLEERLNAERTNFDLHPKDIDFIMREVKGLIVAEEQEKFDQIRDKQQIIIKQLLIDNPDLKTALSDSSLSEFLQKLRFSDRDKNSIQERLSLEKARVEGRLRAMKGELIKNLRDPDTGKRAHEYYIKSSEHNKNELAKYVALRKSVLEVFEELRGYQDDTGKYPYEDTVHELIFPRFKSNETVDYSGHNLWLVDDRLSFVNYISSDRTLAGKSRQKGEKVTDILCYEDCGIWSTGEDVSSGHLIMVEFKRPGRSGYTRQDNPVQQVYDTLHYIREQGSLKTENGRTIEVDKKIPAIIYIVADRDPSFTKILEHEDFEETWDHRGYFKFHKNLRAYIEVITFDKLLLDAKARNKAFLARLFPEDYSL